MSGRGRRIPSVQDTIKSKGPGVWVINHHRRGLIHRTIRQDERWTTAGQPKRTSGFRISIAELQRMHLRKLQILLVEDVVDMCKMRDEEPEGWEQRLESYIKAVHDYEYMQQCSQKTRDPFLITAERSVDDYILASLVPQNAALEDIWSTEPWEHEALSTPIGGTRHETYKETWQRAFVEKLAMAIIGAILLVGPMWLMVLHNTMWTGLISTSAFVLLFGILAAWHLDDKEKVLATTAAYAAVLVVFVGLNVESEAGRGQ